MGNLDILNLEWTNSDRDLHIVMPVLIYLNKKYNLSFETKSIFNGYYYLIKYRPKILIISNFGGAGINYEITKLAYIMGIKVVSCISEGNVSEDELEQFLWGWNRDKILYADKMLLWSKRSENIFLSIYPNLKDKLITTGATGFDRYNLLKFETKEEFLEKNILKFNKIIGIAAWGFDRLFGVYYLNNEECYLNAFGQAQIDMHRNDLFKLQQIYRKLIENNPDILFILRYHPGTMNLEKNEFFKLDKYENVFVSSKYQNNQYQISDLISMSDIWIGYETTTTLEAWLLSKQTFLINPTQSNFVRVHGYKGSPIVKTTQEAQELINEYFTSGKIKSFEKLGHFREEIVKNVIEYGDGKNHIRASIEILEVFNRPDKKIKYGFKIYKEAFTQIIKLILSKTIMKKRWSELNYKSNFAEPYQEMYSKVIDV